MEFMQARQFYLSLQLDDNKKRLRTKVSEATKHPVFDEAFRTTDFEEDFAIIGADSIERTLTLDVFVVLTKDDSTSAHELLGSVTVPLPRFEPSDSLQSETRALSFTRLEKKSNSQIDVGRFKLEMVEVRKTPKPRTPALSMQSEASDLSEINAVTPERPASDVVRLVVHARSATLGDAVDSELRLRCSTGNQAAETAAQVCSAACTVVWNELLVLEAPRDAELNISVLGDGERNASIDVNQLKPFKSYTLDLPLEGPGGWAAHVTVAAHDDASNVVYLLKPVLDLGPTKAPSGTAIAVAQLVQRHVLSKLSEERRQAPPLFPVTLRPPAEDYEGDEDIICRRPTLYTEVAGGRAVWDDRSVVFAGDGDALLVDFYAGDGERGDLTPAHVGFCVLDVPSSPTSEAGVPATVAVHHRSGSQIGTCAARVRVEARSQPPATARTSATARSQTPSLLSRGLTPGPQLASTTEWEAATPRVQRASGGDDDGDPRVRRLADDLAAKQLAVQRLMMELEGRGDALRACGAEMAALRRRADQAEKARETLEAKVAEEEAKRTSHRHTFETLVAERSRGRSVDTSDPTAQLRAAASLCAQLKRENADLTEATKGATSASSKLKDLQAEHAHLRRAHTQQAAYVQSLQDDRTKADAYRTTIGVQERVIAKLEDLVSNSLRELAAGRKAELAASVARADPSAHGEAVRLSAALQHRDQRIAMLETQLHEQATKDARELAEARLKIFELEMERAGAPPEQRAPGFSGVVEEALRASRREAAADRRETNRLKFRSAANAVHAARAAAPVPSPGFADVVGEAYAASRLPAVDGAYA